MAEIESGKLDYVLELLKERGSKLPLSFSPDTSDAERGNDQQAIKNPGY
jgi:hypothetical protein